MTKLKFNFISLDNDIEKEIEVSKAVIAGWTSSDRDAVEKHIRELEELGVKRPERTPCYYPVSSSRLSTGSSIEVIGSDSSGEVEFIVLRHDGELWLGAGSDHTDRKVEVYDVIVSKQLCDKPVAPAVWRFADLESHWDRLVMKSYIIKDGNRTLYQEGPVTGVLHPYELIKQYEEVASRPFSDNSLMYCGTFPAIGGIRMSPCFEYEISDPVLQRKIGHNYDIEIIDM